MLGNHKNIYFNIYTSFFEHLAFRESLDLFLNKLISNSIFFNNYLIILIITIVTMYIYYFLINLHAEWFLVVW